MKTIFASTLLLLLLNLSNVVLAQTEPSEQAEPKTFVGATIETCYGYDDCLELSNENVSVTLCPAAGGRVLQYSLDVENILYLPPGDEGWQYNPDENGDARKSPMHAGRFDIGPEKVVDRGPLLWMGKWDAEIIGDRVAKLTSQYDPQSGVQLTRTFELAGDSSHLICTQTIHNVSDKPVSLCHWSRTFAKGNGIVIVPRSPDRSLNRFPNGYFMYLGGRRLDMLPTDPNILVTPEEVVIKAPAESPKTGFDSHAGWLAYAAPNDQLFVKRFRTYPQRAYSDVAGFTVAIWYPKDKPLVELEPIGPAEHLTPDQQASFTEEWWLLKHPFPDDGATLDIKKLREKVRTETKPPK